MYKKTLDIKATRMSLEQAEHALHTGTITQRDFDRYWIVWCWSAPRYSGVAGLRHDRLYNKDQSKYMRRINRMRRVLGDKPYYDCKWIKD